MKAPALGLKKIPPPPPGREDLPPPPPIANPALGVKELPVQLFAPKRRFLQVQYRGQYWEAGFYDDWNAVPIFRAWLAMPSPVKGDFIRLWGDQGAIVIATRSGTRGDPWTLTELGG